MARGHHPRRSVPPSEEDVPAAVDEQGYQRLATLRAGIRTYLAWAEKQANQEGLTPAQVQLALVVRAHPDPAGPTVTDLARALLLRHHSVVGLIDRAEQAGLVTRVRDEQQLSRVHVQLTPEGADRLAALSARHLQWLAHNGGGLGDLYKSFAADPPTLPGDGDGDPVNGGGDGDGDGHGTGADPL
jgi:DNA-binding MarR family transcriptional regulator